MTDIQVLNIKRLEGVPFAAYKEFGAHFNYSFLKREKAGVTTELALTDKIMLGTLVDAILTESRVDMLHPLFPHARKVASYIKANFGSLLPHLAKQVSYTGEMHYQGFVLPVKGRLDFELPKRMVIDLKVTSEANIRALIDYMGYADQQFGYYSLAQAPESYILAYSTKTKKAEVIKLEVTKFNSFWAEKILRFGSAA